MVIQSRRGKRKSGRGLLLVWMLLIGVAGVAGGAFFYKQEISGFFQQAFSRQEKATEKKKNGRGTIYDRSFKELAISQDRVSVFVRPRELEDLHTSAERLAAVLGMNEQELLERFDKDVQQTWLAKDISLEEEKAVSELGLPGVFLHREQVRSYPYKQIAAHVIGFADHNMGLAGTEHFYNRLLDQTSISQADFPNVDLQGHHRTGGSGQHLVLTIDLKIQDFLEKYVAALGAVHEGAELAALLMETETGAIVANANFPSFDPNLYYQYGKESLTNILLEPILIPPSIQRFFKDAALLRTTGERDQQFCPWSIAAGVPDPERERQLWQQLGLAALPELDFSAQNGGDVAGLEPVSGALAGNTADMPWQATPMQILLGVNSLVNGGRKVVPHVLDRVLERNGDREYFFRVAGGGKEAVPVFSPASLETWIFFKAQARAGVLDAAFLDAQGLSLQPVLNKGGEYHRNRMVLAVLPGEKPELILMVVMRQPYLEPSSAAVKEIPAFAGSVEKILPSMVALQQVYKNLSDMMSISERKESNYQQQEKKKKQDELETILKEQHPLMPELTGLSLRKALRLLQDKNVRVRIQGTGRVVAQSPAAGVPLNDMQECRLTLKKDEKVDPKVPAKSQSARDRKTEEGKRPEIKK
jgi:cell division protein FtsI (penicillin-binding protein 3)